jgi:hypothetical protein
MGLLRPGTKVRFWTPGYKNKPTVHPPGLLSLVSVLSLFSAIGTLIYAVIQLLSAAGGSGIDAQQSIYIAFLHFLLPICVAYTISTNSPYSRILILLYCAVLYAATLAGKGYLGALEIDASDKTIVASGILLIVILWLFASPKMRLYYVLISDRPIPEELESRAPELLGKTWLGPKGTKALEWLTDNLETAVLIGFIVVAVYAAVS